MTNEEAIKELRDASDSEVRYGDTEYHYDKVMKRVEAFDMAIKALEQTELNPSYNGVKSELEQQPSEDCISRKSVDTLVDELARAISDERCCMSRGRSTATIMQDILDLPSVTPQPSEDWYDVPSDEMTLEQARQAVKNLRKKLAEHLEQQPNRCDSCVHSEEQDGSNCYECVKGITDNFELMRDATEEERKSVKDYVESISKPTGVHFDETQPKTGHWIKMGDGFTPYECSECEKIEFKKSNYCPNCGAKMEVEE